MQEVNYDKIIWDTESFVSELRLWSKIDYYNINAGFWEPFIEIL